MAVVGLGMIATATAAAATTPRLHFEVWIEGARRGSAWIESAPDHGRYASGLDLQVVHERTPVWVKERLQIRRDGTGQWIRIDASSSTGRDTQRVRLVRRGDVLRWQSAGQRRELRSAPQLLLEDQWLAQAAWVQRAGLPDVRVQSLDPWLAGAVSWHLQGDGTGVTLQEVDGQARHSLRFNAQDQLQHQVVERSGLTLEWRACSAPCTSTPIRALDLLERQAVRAPYAIPDAARSGPIRYRLRVPAEWREQLPRSVEQQWSVQADGSVLLTVCPQCTGIDPPPTPAELERWRAPDPWIQSGDARVRRFARQAGGPRTPALTRMRRLQTLVSEHLHTIERMGYHTALDALTTGRGDCTESALLLAATARASGLPTRIVAGLVYSQRYSGRRDVYTPHYWVQVWIDERWHSFDAGIGSFDATHLALVVGHGHPHSTQPILARSGEVQILRMARVR